MPDCTSPNVPQHSQKHSFATDLVTVGDSTDLGKQESKIASAGRRPCNNCWETQSVTALVYCDESSLPVSEITESSSARAKDGL